MTTHNDWRPKYTARLHELWRQERDVGSRPEAADLTTASQQDFISLAERSKQRRDDALFAQMEKLLTKSRVVPAERRDDLRREIRRLTSLHTDPGGANAWVTQHLEPGSEEDLDEADEAWVLALLARQDRLREKLAREIGRSGWSLIHHALAWQATHPEHGTTPIYIEMHDMMQYIRSKTPLLPMETAAPARRVDSDELFSHNE